MPTRNVVITDHQKQLVDELVASGEYQNVSEVLREGLRLVEKQREEHLAMLEALRRHVDAAEFDLVEGRYTDIEVDGIGDFVDDLARDVTEARTPR
ncbi:MAG TPA: type II toxin-antitoxin system ParD family antitoxin [Candidatus Corynebacterium avicola]|uniref:Type II toxin-antitoxin system ParD family antitoxin n=1 Tax=Candidatus Corynebacterium avicola TaxID=2838527 RepID=A0A9D1RND4_9CORY|nr:type II toxin-antitoxin system ParD family antitoxin [Candidatus Corynebacterium avicola]